MYVFPMTAVGKHSMVGQNDSNKIKSDQTQLCVFKLISNIESGGSNFCFCCFHPFCLECPTNMVFLSEIIFYLYKNGHVSKGNSVLS